MALLLTSEDKIARLTSLLTINTKYCISFGKHTAEAVLLESRKSKGKDQDKTVKKADGKLVSCWLFQFDSFKLLVDIATIQDIQLTTKGVKLVFRTYDGVFERCE